jgi:hypothetical protein
MNENTIKEILTAGEAVVTFEKVNGEIRTMRCTLVPEVVEPHIKGTGSRKSFTALPVFDLDIGAWRSFRIDSVISVVPIA